MTLDKDVLQVVIGTLGVAGAGMVLFVIIGLIVKTLRWSSDCDQKACQLAADHAANEQEAAYDEMQQHVLQVSELYRDEIADLKSERNRLVEVIASLHGGKRVAKLLRKQYGIPEVKRHVSDEPNRMYRDPDFDSDLMGI